MQTFPFLEIIGIIGLGSLFSTIVGVLLKYWFERKTRETEVFTDTFKRFSNLTAEYYMPMAVLAGRTARVLESLPKQTQHEPEFGFFVLARFHLRVLNYILDAGGYLMRDWRNDRIQGKLYSKTKQKMPFSDADISVMQFIAKDCDNYILFKRKLKNPSSKIEEEQKLVELYQQFITWTQEKPDDVEEVIKILRCYSNNLLRTITEMYGSWYDKSSKEAHQLSPSCKEEIEKIRKELKRKPS